jgi:hypothetical protein
MARGRRAAAALRVYEYLQRRPIAIIDAVSEGIGMSRRRLARSLDSRPVGARACSPIAALSPPSTVARRLFRLGATLRHGVAAILRLGSAPI